MNVLLDIHHHDLFRSLYLLFRKRFGFNVFIPYGMEWNTLHNYANYPSIDTVKQYLVGVKHWINIANDLNDLKFLTLEEFKDIDMDICVASLMENLQVYHDLNKSFDKKSKIVVQVGNNFPVSCIDNLGRNLMSSSTVVYNLSSIKHKIFYHQEFDTSFFKPPEFLPDIKSVYSLQHYFGQGIPPYELDFKLFNTLKNKMPDFCYTCFGLGGDGGDIVGIPKEVSDVIKRCGFIFHVKPQGDGYGHIYHNAFGCGKPVIYKSEYLYYNDIPMTPTLLFDDDTSIDLSRLNVDEAVNKILNMSNQYEHVTKMVYDKFKSVVNFDEEFVNIKKFVENLQ